MRIVLWLGIAAALLSPSAHAADHGFRRLEGTQLPPAKIDETVGELMAAAHVPGLALALINDGQVVYLKAYGYRNVERKLPLETDTVMYGASLTKAAFAYMVMQLVDEGVIDLDKSIADYLPKPLPAYEKYADLANDERWRKFTPRILLSHTTGMPNFRFLNDDGKLDIEHEPGTRYGYSGEGINLLQFVIEQGLGKDVGELIQRRVFDRFDMTRTSMMWRDDFLPNLAVGYDENGKALGHNKRSHVRAAGSMDTTVADYAKFLAGLLRGEGLSAKARGELLRPQIAIHSVQQFPTMLTQTTHDNDGIELSYGLGWGVFKTPKFGWAYFKEGHDDGTNNYAISFDRGRTAMLVLTNSSNGESMFKYLADRLLGETCLPWFWEGYIPYDHPELREPEAREQSHPPCGPVK
ncbi:MAG: serine hydrolase [Alphaproteobacteria bacterium]|nr:serine hydrolase [Alphaproteobacteria bacterium]